MLSQGFQFNFIFVILLKVLMFDFFSLEPNDFTLSCGDTRLNLATRTITRFGCRQHVDPLGFQNLAWLILNANHTVNGVELYYAASGNVCTPKQASRNTSVALSRLRMDLGFPDYLKSIPHCGYRVETGPDDKTHCVFELSFGSLAFNLINLHGTRYDDPFVVGKQLGTVLTRFITVHEHALDKDQLTECITGKPGAKYDRYSNNVAVHIYRLNKAMGQPNLIGNEGGGIYRLREEAPRKPEHTWEHLFEATPL